MFRCRIREEGGGNHTDAPKKVGLFVLFPLLNHTLVMWVLAIKSLGVETFDDLPPLLDKTVFSPRQRYPTFVQFVRTNAWIGNEKSWPFNPLLLPPLGLADDADLVRFIRSPR